MAGMKCQKCEWVVPQDETWDEKAEEHTIETGHCVFLVDRRITFPEDRW